MVRFQTLSNYQLLHTKSKNLMSPCSRGRQNTSRYVHVASGIISVPLHVWSGGAFQIRADLRKL